MGISPGPAGRQRRTAIEPLERAIHPCCSNSSKGWIMRLFDRSLHFLLFAYLFCSSVHIANEAVEKKLDNVKTIYVIPMKDRLEHFLTNEIVKWGQFEVTLNPREADVLLSDTTDVNVKELLSDSAKIRRTTSRTATGTSRSASTPLPASARPFPERLSSSWRSTRTSRRSRQT